MLQMKELKPLIKMHDRPYSLASNAFDIKLVSNADRSKAFSVDFDPIHKIVFLEFSVQEETMVISLDAKQAVQVGAWLTEAGTIVNFIENVGIEFEEGDIDGDEENADSE